MLWYHEDKQLPEAGRHELPTKALRGDTDPVLVPPQLPPRAGGGGKGTGGIGFLYDLSIDNLPNLVLVQTVPQQAERAVVVGDVVCVVHELHAHVNVLVYGTYLCKVAVLASFFFPFFYFFSGRSATNFTRAQRKNVRCIAVVLVSIFIAELGLRRPPRLIKRAFQK